MPKLKNAITEEDVKEIIRLYISKEIPSAHKLGEKYKVGHKKISKILKDNNVIINTKGGQIRDGNSSFIEETKVIMYNAIDGKKIVAKCKKTGIVFDDANNISGCLTTHIKKEYGYIDIPTNTYQRKKYEIGHNKKWFEEYFDIIEIGKDEIRKCGLCDWETEDILNKTGCFEGHLKHSHSLELVNYLGKFPEDIKYHTNYSKNKDREKQLLDTNKNIICAICGEKMFVLNNSHLKKHNISGYEYKLKYSGKLMCNDLTLRTAKRLASYNLSDNIKRKQTKPEIELCNLLNSWGITYTTSNRSILGGKEIDILIEDKHIGIEFNGNIHHTEFFGGKTRNYHLNKTKEANAKGYGLIHIFSDEFRNRKDIVISKLSNIFNVSDSIKIGARECIVKEISLEMKNDFLETYHIQGSDFSTIKLGAFFEGVLVGVMTFRNQVDKSELTRFATNYNYNIIGLGSKMLSYFIKKNNPKKIISFADRRWTLDSTNNLYVKMGFKLIEVLKPDYRYYHPNNHNEDREHKFGFRKNTLVKKYPNKLNLGMTESEMIKVLNYDRIWDCGLFKYELICTELKN